MPEALLYLRMEETVEMRQKNNISSHGAYHLVEAER